MQLVDLIANDQSVACVVSALKARNHVSALAQPVHDLAFAFVTPLGAYHHDVGHVHPLGTCEPTPSLTTVLPG